MLKASGMVSSMAFTLDRSAPIDDEEPSAAPSPPAPAPDPPPPLTSSAVAKSVSPCEVSRLSCAFGWRP